MNKLYKGNCFDILPTLEIGDNAVIVTDPPFNIGYHYRTYKDKMKEEQYLDELKSVINRTGAVRQAWRARDLDMTLSELN